MKLDFHVHTKYSPDSIIQPGGLVKKSIRTGIIPAVTDHDSIRCHRDMRSLKSLFIPGEEIRTDCGDLTGLYITEQIPTRTEFCEAIDQIHEQGGLAYLPHMYDYGRAGDHADEEDAAKVDIIEVFNARCLKQEYNERAMAFAKLHDIPGATGSDSHFLFEFGKTYTELPDFDIEEPKALLRAIKAAAKMPLMPNTGNAHMHTKPAPVYVRGVTKMMYLARKLIFR